MVKNLLHRTNARVIATCRNLDGATDLKLLQKQFGPDRLITACLDLRIEETFQEVKNQIQGMGINSIDVLIANAAVSSESHPHDHMLTARREEVMEVFNTNVGGNLMLLQVFHDMVCNSQLRMVMIVSSKLGSITCASQEDSFTAYRISKAGLNMLSVLFAQEGAIRSAGCKLIVTHPGHVETYLGTAGGQTPQISVDESTNALIDLIAATACIQIRQLGERFGEQGKTFQFQPSMEDVFQKPNLEDFVRVVQEDNKVFVNYNGSLLPW